MEQRCEDTPTTLSSGETVYTKLRRIAEKAKAEPNFRFTSLFHLITKDLLWDCFHSLREDAASGVDNITKEAYGANLSENLDELTTRIQRMGYRALPVKRVYIPKPGSDKMRPLGIPALEDKLVQAAMVKILNAIYEQDFVDESYGFRPGRGCHDALRALSLTVENHQVNHIVEADIKSFFDTVAHDQLVTFLEHRIADKRMLRMIQRFLKVGVLEDNTVRKSEEGTPQGGVISPLLANIYLHYVLDLWVTKIVAKQSMGLVKLIRYADDFVVCFRFQDDADRFYANLEKRLAKFNLAVEPTKTKRIEFGPYAVGNARRMGVKPGTFDFLGFTHYCSNKRNGKGFRMKRKTSRKKYKAKLALVRDWLKRVRHQSTQRIIGLTGLKLAGHYRYYGVTDNYPMLARFKRDVEKLLYKWLDRRGKRNSMTWEWLNDILKYQPLPNPRIFVNMFAQRKCPSEEPCA